MLSTSPTPTLVCNSVDTSPSGFPAAPYTLLIVNWQDSPWSARLRLYWRGCRVPSGSGTCTVIYWPGSEGFTRWSSTRLTTNVTTSSVSWIFFSTSHCRHQVVMDDLVLLRLDAQRRVLVRDAGQKILGQVIRRVHQSGGEGGHRSGQGLLLGAVCLVAAVEGAIQQLRVGGKQVPIKALGDFLDVRADGW